MKLKYKIIAIAAAALVAAAAFSGCRDAKRENSHASKAAEISDSDRLSLEDYRTKLFTTFQNWSKSIKAVTNGLYGSDDELLSFAEVSAAIEESKKYLDEFKEIYPPKSLDKEHNEMLLAIDGEYKWLDEAEAANNAREANNLEAFRQATEEATKALNATTFPAEMLELVKAVNATASRE